MQSGPYSIYACGSNATSVSNGLNLLWTDLLPAITDSMTGITSPAYAGLFKDDDYAPYITKLLTNVSTGAQVTTLRSRVKPVTPLFACASTPGVVTLREHQVTIDMYSQCTKAGAPPAFAWSNNHWIVLCPAYFTDFPLKASIHYCPSTDFMSNQMRLWGHLVFYKPFVLLHELAHVYIRASQVRPVKNYEETYDWNGALGLSALESTLNPQNYAFYVAGKYFYPRT